MGLEQRGNGTYLYKKERIGGRVISRYVGRGELVGMLHLLDVQERREREQAERKALGEIERTDRVVSELGELAHTVARAMLLTNGCHTHKGQWRKWRTRIKR